MKHKINFHFIYILISAIFWGTAGIYVRTLSATSLSQMGIVFGRSFFTALILAVLIIFKDKKYFRFKFKDLPLFIGAAVFSIILFNYSYYKTMSLTSLSVAAVLLYTAPFFVVILSVFLFKEKLTFKKVCALLVAFVGCLFVTGVFGSKERLTPVAILFGLLTGFGYALYTIFSRILIDKGYNTFTITFYTFLFSAVFCLPLINVTKTVSVLSSSDTALFTLILMALFNTVIPYIFYTKGLLGVEASVAPIIATLEPVVATVTGILIYGEKLTLSGFFGIVLVLGSVLILNLRVKSYEN